MVVFERQPFFAPELQRQFLGEDVAVRACRMAPDVDAGEADVAVVHLDAAPRDVLQWLARRRVIGRDVPTIVVASEAMAEMEWPVRELGATSFVDEFVGGAHLARLCRKSLRRSTT